MSSPPLGASPDGGIPQKSIVLNDVPEEKADADNAEPLQEDGQAEDTQEQHVPVDDNLEKGEAITRVVTAQDWSGPSDPENPQNWPRWKKVYHTTVPAVLGFAITFGSSVYTPAIGLVSSELHISTEVAILGLSLWTLGLAFGPVLAAPLSETLGRTAVYRMFILSLLFTLGAGLSNNATSLMVCRFFAGFFGSPVLAVGAGTNVDIWQPIYRAAATVMFIWSPFTGPSMGPLVGGFVAENLGWRWTQWCILFVGAAGLLWSLPMSETNKKVILRRRAKRLGIAPPKATGPTGKAAIWYLLTVTLFRPLHMLVTEPIVGFFSLYIAFNFSVLFGFFDAFPIVFEGVYGFNGGQAGLPWISIFIGCSVSVPTVIFIDRHFYHRQHEQAQLKANGSGLVAPEHRLYAAMIGSLGLPVGLFWFGWTARSDIHWISPTLASIPFAWGNLCVFTSAALYLVDVYGPATGASALAANGLLRYTLGAIFPLFTDQMYHNLGIAWATSVFGFISVALLPIPWVLFKYGPQIRAKSQYETIKV